MPFHVHGLESKKQKKKFSESIEAATRKRQKKKRAHSFPSYSGWQMVGFCFAFLIHTFYLVLPAAVFYLLLLMGGYSPIDRGAYSLQQAPMVTCLSPVKGKGFPRRSEYFLRQRPRLAKFFFFFFQKDFLVLLLNFSPLALVIYYYSFIFFRLNY